METEIINIIHKKAAEGKVLTDGNDYVHEIFLAPSEDETKWSEIDASEIPESDNTDK